MIKISKQKFLATIMLLAILITYTGYATLSPTVHAQEITETTDSQQATAILGNVVGLNMNAYTTNLISHVSSATAISNLPQDNLIYNLTSAQSSVRASCTFINGNLNMLYLSDYTGSPSLNQPVTNARAMAQGFLQRYQSYTGDSLYGSLSSMLDNITLNANVTAISGNVKLQASVFGSNNAEQDLVWSYVDKNGIPASMKDVVLTYRNGQLESFLDNWQLYTTQDLPTVSSQTAIATALQAAKGYSYTAESANGANVTISGFKVAAVFNVSLSYLNYYEDNSEQSIRSGDPYLLYPSWYVGIGFNQSYPGGVTGLNIRVWADTGNVSSIEPIIWNIAPTANKAVMPSITDTAIRSSAANQALSTILLPIVVVISGSMTMVGVCANKKLVSGFKHARKLNLKRKVIALCLIFPLVFILIGPTVFASSIKSETFISAAGYPYVNGELTQFDWKEIDASQDVGDGIYGNYSMYNDNVYCAENNFPTNNNYAYNLITGNIQSDETNYNSISVFAFGNGPGQYYDLSDSPVVNITNSEIQQYTAAQKVTFAWQFSCQSAGNLTPNEVNYNWAWDWTGTNYQSMYSTDAFCSPDSSGHCFIGFNGQAPMISQDSFEDYTQLAYQFIEYFYEAATSGYTVHDSLNIASEALFGVPYLYTPFREGYMAYWPGGDGYQQGYDFAGYMEVFGDADITICQGSAESVSSPSISLSNDGYGSPNTAYQIGLSSTDSNGYPVSYLINWGDGTWTMTGAYNSGYTKYFDHSYSSGGNYAITAYAVSQDGVWSSPNTSYVTIGGPYTITLYAEDSDGLLSPNVYVDGNWVGTAPVTFQVTEGYHTISVDDATYDPTQQTYVSFQYMYDSDNYYGNGQSILFTNYDTLWAYYC